MSTTRTNPDPARWMLGGEPPEPQNLEPAEAVDVDDLRTGDTHTGTDPFGRAIGPREDHLKVKRVVDPESGEIVVPKGGPGMTATKAEGRARRIAEATDTKAEAVDDPTPIPPSAIAKAHAAGVVVEVEDEG